MGFNSNYKTPQLQYKAILSQNAPIAATKTPTIVAGQIWEHNSGSPSPADLSELGNYELISGTIGNVGAKYRSTAAATPTFDRVMLKYDGAPYIVSTNAAGDFAPFVNILGGNPTFSYVGVGSYTLILNGAFPIGKTFLFFGSYTGTNGQYLFYRTDDNTLQIYTIDSTGQANANDELNNTAIQIEVYP